MTRNAIIMTLLLFVTAFAWSQEKVGDGRIPYYKGYNWRIDENGDSMYVLYLQDIYIYPKLKFKNEKQKQEYDRLTRNVKITLPYAKLIAETLVETYEYIETLPTKKEREQYLSRMEKEIFNQYKPTLKKFSKTQAKVLIKLIQRETHQSSYDIIRAFLGSLRATFWQGFGKLFGVSLKADYNPEKNHEDALIERIASQVELGIL
ncbi:MAG: DUF4294 domain-containing protein [Bacteroidales bacterium]|nr:DUF4294 domain-containing protein [Bacteroidales bacterium]